MAFLSKKLVEKEEITPHPLLRNHALSPSAKVAYLQGCVLATLLDDANISSDEYSKIAALGGSLGLTEEDVNESVETVKGLASDSDQDMFLNELKSAVSERSIIKFFMADFERLMQKPEGLSADAEECLNFIGKRLVGKTDWRSSLAAGEEVQSNDNVGDECSSTGGDDSRHDNVELWLSRVGSVALANAVLQIVVKTLPTAKMYPDWALGQIKEVVRTGNPACLERSIDSAIAAQTMSELRAISADGFVKG